MKTQKTIKIALATDFNKLLQEAFRNSAIATQFSTLAEQYRKQLKTVIESPEYLLSEDSESLVEAESEKRLKTEYGTIQYVSRTSYKIDREELVAMVAAGSLSVEMLVNLAFPNGKVSSVDPLKTALGSKFDEISTATTTEHLSLLPTASLKNLKAVKQSLTIVHQYKANRRTDLRLKTANNN